MKFRKKPVVIEAVQFISIARLANGNVAIEWGGPQPEWLVQARALDPHQSPGGGVYPTLEANALRVPRAQLGGVLDQRAGHPARLAGAR